ncbi:hypothetical protein R1flu_021948 [Riccia fluitans]|uniref:Ornithine cyclodeaminase n=1 Tax=Riccia fluitans TaxID=41844 RepID=A0ABD1ZQT3_9MARC
MEGGLVIEKETIRTILTYSALVDRLKEAFDPTLNYTVPERHHHTMESTGGTLLLMPAWSSHEINDGKAEETEKRRAFMGVKIVSIFPNNPDRGLASVLGVYILSCGMTGRPLALINGTELTLWRTACVSALAARYLVRPDARVLAMVGAGALASHLIQAHIAASPSIETIVIWNRTHERAHLLADNLRRLPIIFGSRAVFASECLEHSVRRADIVICATMSAEPLVLGQWLKPGVHLSLVGAFKPSMRECDDETVKVSNVYVDVPAAVAESGDLHGPISRGVVSRSDVIGELADLVGLKVPGRQNVLDITLFKSVGSALQDLAAAQLLYELTSASNCLLGS